MIIHKLDRPKNNSYCFGDDHELTISDFSELNKFEIDEVWYWYVSGSYEGDGVALMRRGDLYDTHDMSHCSCYWVFDRMEYFNGVKLDELSKGVSGEYNNRIEHLIEAARKS